MYFSHWLTPTFGINKLHQQQKEIIWQFHWKKKMLISKKKNKLFWENNFLFGNTQQKNLGKFRLKKKKAFFLTLKYNMCWESYIAWSYPFPYFCIQLQISCGMSHISLKARIQ